VLGKVTRHPFDSGLVTRLDWMASSMMAWNGRYHARTAWQRFRPGSVFFVLRKR
jgi:hypothetical protein